MISMYTLVVGYMYVGPEVRRAIAKASARSRLCILTLTSTNDRIAHDNIIQP